MHAVGKILSERLAHPDVICLSLGCVWCPIKGIDCKEAGDNKFVFTFFQESGKRKALDDGPWMFDKDLVVVEDFVPSRRMEDYVFNSVPIWVRVFNLPLGMMTAEAAEEIGDIIGQYVDADTNADGSAIGKYLRVKVRMRIDKPLMRGFTLEEEERVDGAGEGEEAGSGWCRFEYEFLPDFCYTCGIIGHCEKDCATKLKKGEKAQFGRWLKADMGYKRNNQDSEGWGKGGRRGSGSKSLGFNRSNGRSGSGSDSLS
ncbi:uncharacterized protein [Aegilops tauschii subsp. strangulata]|uniref:uncharacterized protein n=1 Tax=Aegilops tauschii subsp. strangulata TaxID=200361 RepID=UPI003CC8C8D5